MGQSFSASQVECSFQSNELVQGFGKESFVYHSNARPGCFGYLDQSYTLIYRHTREDIVQLGKIS